MQYWIYNHEKVNESGGAKIKHHKLEFAISLLIVVFTCASSATNAFAAKSSDNSSLAEYVEQAEKERLRYGQATDSTIKNIEDQLNERGIDSGSYSGMNYIQFDERNNKQSGISLFGYGETHKIDKTWSYRVDKPSSSNAKPHVHVYKRGTQVGTENVDGTSSHGRTLNKVPKKVKEKVRSSRDYKKAKNDLAKMKRAKSEINKKHLNLNNAKDLVIAAGIFVSIVGVAFFAPAALPAALLAI